MASTVGMVHVSLMSIYARKVGNIPLNQNLYDMNNSIWLLDSDASQHMTGRFEFLHDIHAIQSCFIGLPNGV